MASYSSIEMQITEKGMAGPRRDRQTCPPNGWDFQNLFFVWIDMWWELVVSYYRCVALQVSVPWSD
jgi:hypothetical protein